MPFDHTKMDTRDIKSRTEKFKEKPSEQVAKKNQNPFNTLFNEKHLHANADSKKTGKWVLSFPKGNQNIDIAWEHIKKGLNDGILYLAKYSKKSDEFTTQSIIVYTYNYSDKNDVNRVYRYLSKLISQEGMQFLGYKRDLETSLDEDKYLYCEDFSHQEKIIRIGHQSLDTTWKTIVGVLLTSLALSAVTMVFAITVFAKEAMSTMVIFGLSIGATTLIGIAVIAAVLIAYGIYKARHSEPQVILSNYPIDLPAHLQGKITAKPDLEVEAVLGQKGGQSPAPQLENSVSSSSTSSESEESNAMPQATPPSPSLFAPAPAPVHSITATASLSDGELVAASLTRLLNPEGASASIRDSENAPSDAESAPSPG